MRRLVALVTVALLVSTAGCGGFPGSNATETSTPARSPTDHATVTATPTDDVSSTKATTRTPTQTPTRTETPEPTPTPTPVPDNPWEAATVNVTFNDQTDSGRAYEDAVVSALEYWNGRTARFSPYDVTFDYTPELSAADADLLVVASEPIEFCGGPVDHNTTTAGCYRNPHRVDIYDNQTNLQFRNTLVHELGHALDLRHGDEPRWAMSTAAYEYSGSIQNATERENPWNTTGPLKVTVGRSLDDRERYLDELDDVVRFYNANDQYRPDGMELEVVDEWYQANVVVASSSETSYTFDGAGTIGFWNGLDYDADDRFEQWTASYVYLNDVEPANAEDHLGYWVGFSLVGSEDELPGRYAG